MFAPNKHSKVYKLHGVVLPKRAEMKNCLLHVLQLPLRNQQNPSSRQARAHTCPKWTVIGLRSSRSLGSLASTSGDGAVFGNCSSMVGAQPFSAMSCREKPVEVDVGISALNSEHRCSLQPQLSGLPRNSPGTFRACPSAGGEGNGRLTWLFDFEGWEKPKSYPLNYKDNIIIHHTGVLGFGGEDPSSYYLTWLFSFLHIHFVHMQTFKNYLRSQLIHNFTFYLFPTIL